MNLDPALERLLARPDLWQGQQARQGLADGESTGFAALDERLPAGGWPRGGLTELLPERHGIGELRLLMPALARLSRGARWVAWIDPPHIPYAAGLYAAGIDLAHTLVVRTRDSDEHLWALEQALRAGTCAAVLGWPGALGDTTARRLQLAAEAGGALGFLFRDPEARREPSFAALRLALASERGGLSVEALRQQGGWPGLHLHLAATDLFPPAVSRSGRPTLTAGRDN